MPFVYVSAKFRATIDLTADDEFVFEQWTSEELAREREEYEQPSRSINLAILNPEDERDVYPIRITEKDVYDGVLQVVRVGRSFTFSFDGKAKINVHKTTKDKLDLGLKPKVDGLVINGQEHPVDFAIDVVIQSKKI